jgi:conjugative relaxase-like TrwC/TraI family protein
MSAASIGASRGGGYARYLESKTVAPERGDYYLTPDGEITQAPGGWLTDDDALLALGVEPGKPVQGADFISLMEGRHPGTGRWLRPQGAGGGRGGGIDATFSAPKSVSTVWALADPWQRRQIEEAHASAVERTIRYMRETVPVVRRRYGAGVVEERAKDLIATEYRHTTARGVSGAEAPDPQLHSHVVITAAVREDDRFVAVASRPVFRAARELGAFYRSALAAELIERGYEIESHTGRDGRYFELAGVPRELNEAFSGRSREVARAAERFRARHGRAPERGELRDLALENRRSKQLATRGDIERVWAQTARRHGFGPDEAVHLVGAPERAVSREVVAERIEDSLTAREAVFEPRELRAAALEQSAGQLSPDEALSLAREMVRERRVLTLEGGRMTTLAVRAQEQAIERRVASLSPPAGRAVGAPARAAAEREVSERLGAPLTPEQRSAAELLSGHERLATLIGPAGTGKGVVIDAVARAEQLVGREPYGVAVSGSTAERLGRDSPALEGRTMTVDALVARVQAGRLRFGPETTVILDEAGMVDHTRLDRLTELVERSGAKLIAVGDGKQLPAIGPGGMFDRLAARGPTAELSNVHRTSDPAERQAWSALRGGEPEKAMAHYHARGQLYFRDTRDEAGEAAVNRWSELADVHGVRQVALIADASNVEIDRLNARAQYLRAQKGELGEWELELRGAHCGLREGDLVAFHEQHRPKRGPRIENGTRAEVTNIGGDGLVVSLEGSGRRVGLDGEDVNVLRLSYAQHVYRQQGATVERSVVVTGGWQTSKESAYVEASRARAGTEWFVAREELGAEGQDADRVRRLAEGMGRSRAQRPSLELPERVDPDWVPSRDPLRVFPLPGPLRWAGRAERSLDRGPDREADRER